MSEEMSPEEARRRLAACYRLILESADETGGAGKPEGRFNITAVRTPGMSEEEAKRRLGQAFDVLLGETDNAAGIQDGT